MFILMAIPLVNLIMLFVWGFSSSENTNKKNFARASLILLVIAIVLWIVVAVFIVGVVGSLMNNLY
jgi:predicted neutral ceramidase superfamily lipid hydrolase